MSSKVVQDATWSYLRENWKQTPVIDIDNTPDQLPPGLCDWVTLQFFFAPEGQASVGIPGDNFWREEGEFLLYIFIPTGTGIDVLRDYGEQLQVLFRGKQIDGIFYESVSAPSPREQQPLAEGSWYAQALAVSYICFKRG